MSDADSLAEKLAMLEAMNADMMAALLRARQRAEEIAWRANTDLIQAVDGKIVRVKPRPPEDRV